MNLKDLFADNNKMGLPFVFMGDVLQCQKYGNALHTFCVLKNSQHDIVIRDNMTDKKYNFNISEIGKSKSSSYSSLEDEIIEIGE